MNSLVLRNFVGVVLCSVLLAQPTVSLAMSCADEAYSSPFLVTDAAYRIPEGYALSIDIRYFPEAERPKPKPKMNPALKATAAEFSYSLAPKLLLRTQLPMAPRSNKFLLKDIVFELFEAIEQKWNSTLSGAKLDQAKRDLADLESHVTGRGGKFFAPIDLSSLGVYVSGNLGSDKVHVIRLLVVVEWMARLWVHHTPESELALSEVASYSQLSFERRFGLEGSSQLNLFLNEIGFVAN
ncbi:MAG: hypothetical protein AAF202_09315 [Pseudomonadota bacterium]